MAAGSLATFVIYEAQFQTAFTEVAMQFADMFNAASGGALTLNNEFHRGDLWQETRFLDTVRVKDRDPLVVTADTDPDVLSQDEQIGVKVNKYILAEQTEDAFRKIAQSPETFSRVIGRQSSERVQVDRVNRIIKALTGAITAGEANFGAGTLIKVAAANIVYGDLNSAFALFGDRASSLNLIVMHSKVWFDLIGHTIATPVGFNVQDFTLIAGTTATFGRPVLVTDSADLVVAGTPDVYRTLLLNMRAGETTQSETARPLLERVGGLQNIVMRTQVEWSDTIKCRGYKWTGLIRPDDTAVALTTNWEVIENATSGDIVDLKSTAGVMLTNADA